MIMNCECLKKIKAKLEDHYKAPVDLDLRQTINMETGESGTSLPPMYFSYYKLGKGGKPERGRTRSFVDFLFCPFCGKKNE